MNRKKNVMYRHTCTQHVCIHTHIMVCMYIHPHTHVHTHTVTHTHTSWYACIHPHTHVHTHTVTHTHTHTHTEEVHDSYNINPFGSAKNDTVGISDANNTPVVAGSMKKSQTCWLCVYSLWDVHTVRKTLGCFYKF